MPVQNRPRSLIRPGRPEHARQLLSTLHVKRAPRQNITVDQRVEIPQPQNRRQRGPHPWMPVKTRGDLPCAEHDQPPALHKRLPAQNRERAARVHVRHHHQRLPWPAARFGEHVSHPLGQRRRALPRSMRIANPDRRDGDRAAQRNPWPAELDAVFDARHAPDIGLPDPVQIDQSSFRLQQQRA